MFLLQCEERVVKTQRRSPVIKYSVSDKPVNQLCKPERQCEAAGEKKNFIVSLASAAVVTEK